MANDSDTSNSLVKKDVGFTHPTIAAGRPGRHRLAPNGRRDYDATTRRCRQGAAGKVKFAWAFDRQN